MSAQRDPIPPKGTDPLAGRASVGPGRREPDWNRSECTLEDLRWVEEECLVEARKLGMNPPETLFHLCSAEEIYDVAARGLPGRYSHWSFGREYEQGKGSYDRGEGRIYELIVNTRPVHAYLLEGNSLAAQTLIIAHCFHPDTGVWTADGIQDIHQVAPGTLVRNAAGQLAEAAPTRRRYTGPMHAIRAGGSTWKVTPEHQFLILSGTPEPGAQPQWVEARDIGSGDWMTVNVPDIGDGTLRVASAGDDKVALDEDYGQSLGRRFASGADSLTASLPERWHEQAPRSFLRGVLRGCVAAGGSAGPDGVSFRASDGRLASQLQEIAMLYGVWFDLRCDRGPEAPSWHGHAAGAEALALFEVPAPEERPASHAIRIGQQFFVRVEGHAVEDYDGDVHCLSVPDGNSFALMNGIISHNCLGHAECFGLNRHLAAVDKRMLPRVKSAAERIARYAEQHGRREVEDWIDHCEAIARQQPLSQLGAARKAREPEFKARPYDDLFPAEARKREEAVKREREAMRTRFPAVPDPDLLGFVAAHARYLQDWQRDIIGIIQAENKYFMPQMRTKVLNEGIATLAHNVILQQLHLPTAAFMEWQALNAGVLRPQAGHPNPYLLGFELLQEAGRIALSHSPADRRRWSWAGSYAKSMERILEVVEGYDDASLIAEFLTPRVCERAKLFAWERTATAGQIRVSSHEAEEIRERLVEMHADVGVPLIEVVDGDGRGRGELWLEHRVSRLGLDREYADGTLQHLAALWGKPVVLQTVKGDDASASIWLHAEPGARTVTASSLPPGAEGPVREGG